MKKTLFNLSATALFVAAIMVNCKKTEAYLPMLLQTSKLSFLLQKQIDLLTKLKSHLKTEFFPWKMKAFPQILR